MIGRPRFRQIPQAGWLRQGLLSCDGSWFLLFFCEGKIIRCCILSPLCCRSSPLPAFPGLSEFRLYDCSYRPLRSYRIFRPIVLAGDHQERFENARFENALAVLTCFRFGLFPVRFLFVRVSSSVILRINPFSHTVSPVSANG